MQPGDLRRCQRTPVRAAIFRSVVVHGRLPLAGRSRGPGFRHPDRDKPRHNIYRFVRASSLGVTPRGDSLAPRAGLPCVSLSHPRQAIARSRLQPPSVTAAAMGLPTPCLISEAAGPASWVRGTDRQTSAAWGSNNQADTEFRGFRTKFRGAGSIGAGRIGSPVAGFTPASAATDRGLACDRQAPLLRETPCELHETPCPLDYSFAFRSQRRE